MRVDLARRWALEFKGHKKQCLRAGGLPDNLSSSVQLTFVESSEFSFYFLAWDVPMSKHADEFELDAAAGRLDVVEETCKVPNCMRHALFVQEGGGDLDSCAKHTQREALVAWCRSVVEHWIQAKLREVSHAYLEGAEFIGTPEEPLVFPSGLTIVESNLDHARFEHVVLEDAQILPRRGSVPDHKWSSLSLPLIGTSFINSSLRGTSFHSDLMNVTFQGSDLTDAEFHGVLEYADLLLHEVRFFNSTIPELALRKCSLSNVKFDGTLIGKLDINDECKLENVDLGNAIIAPRQLNVRQKLIVGAGCTIPEAFRPLVQTLRDQGKVEGEFASYVPQTPAQKMFELSETMNARSIPRTTPRLFSTMEWLSASAIATVLSLAALQVVGFNLSANGTVKILVTAGAIVGAFRIFRRAPRGDGLCPPG